MWFLDKKVYPNINRLNDLLKSSYSIGQLISLIDDKVEMATTVSKQYFKQDLLPFIDNPLLLDGYVENFYNNYNQSKKYLSG